MEAQPVDGMRPGAALGALRLGPPRVVFLENVPKVGSKLRLRLNTGSKLIVNKYHKGKLKREFKRAC